MIRSKMLKPFGEQQAPFIVPNACNVFSLLGNMKKEDLQPGFKLTCTVTRAMEHFVIVSLPVAGPEGTIASDLLVDEGVPVKKASTAVRRGQVLDVIVLYQESHGNGPISS